MNLFEIATKHRYRYPSVKGLMSTEDLWALPLKSANGPSLNTIAIALSKSIKDSGEESFVDSVTPENTVLKQKLEIVKRVIEVKQEENRTRVVAKANREQKQKILGIIADKEDETLRNGTSLVELQAMADKL